jgi:hypothetical protein
MLSFPSYFLILARNSAEHILGSKYENQHRMTINYKYLPHFILFLSILFFIYNAYLNFNTLIDGSCSSK